MKKALLFDCDGVIGDTEQHGHLPAFNQMWKEKGVNWEWNLEQYREKLKIGGGKERMASLAQDPDFRAVFDVPESEEEWWQIVSEWHKRKSEIFKERVHSGAIPGRPGVKRLAEEALDAGWEVAVCSTSAVSSVKAMAGHVMGEETLERLGGIFAGDMVKEKKPAPDVYNLASRELEVDPANCVVIEDNRNGLLAAVAANMICVVTYNELTKDEDFTEASLVVSHLGDPGEEAPVVAANPAGVSIQDRVNVRELEQLLASR